MLFHSFSEVYVIHKYFKQPIQDEPRGPWPSFSLHLKVLFKDMITSDAAK